MMLVNILVWVFATLVGTFVALTDVATVAKTVATSSVFYDGAVFQQLMLTQALAAVTFVARQTLPVDCAHPAS